MSEKKMVRRSIAVTLGIICLILAVGLVGAFAYYMPMVNDKNDTISSLNSQVANLQNQITSINSTINSPSSQVAELGNQVVSQISQLKQYLNATQTGKTGRAIQIQSMAIVGGTWTVYVQNVGESPVSFVDPCVYVNGTSTKGAPHGSFNPGTTAEFDTSYALASGDTVTVKVVSADGTFSQVMQTLTL